MHYLIDLLIGFIGSLVGAFALYWIFVKKGVLG
jgi:hypothetical protein